MRLPKYRLNPDGRAFVEHRRIPIKSNRLYFGRYDSPESLEAYDKWLALFHKPPGGGTRRRSLNPRPRLTN